MLGMVHLFDWDEINFAECAREMVLSGNWFRPQIDFEPFWEKPPLFLWFQACSMEIFGINEFAARFPNAICGIFTLMLVYHLGRRLHDRMFGWLWVLAWIGSVLPHVYFRSGIIDPWFNLFIFTALYGFIEFRWQFFTKSSDTSWWVRHRHLIFGGLSLGLAVLTKGPTAILIAFLVLIIYWARYKFKARGYLTHLLLFGLATLAAPAIWFGLELALHGPWFIHEFVQYQIRLFMTKDSGHGGFWGYHFLVLLVGCFPVSVFALHNLWGDRQPEEELLETSTLDCCKRSDFGTWMQLLFWVVLILFSIVQTKIVHYSSLAYFPITYLGAVVIWRGFHWDYLPRLPLILLPILGLALGIAVASTPWLGTHIEQLKPLFQKDRFALGNLDAVVAWNWYHGFSGILLIFSVLVGIYAWIKRLPWVSAQVLFSGGAIFTASTLLLLVPNIEAYSQLAAIEFYESKCGEDCFVRPIGFKSYAHLFYTCKRPILGDVKQDEYEIMAHGKPDRPVYFVAKVTNLGELPSLSDCHELYRKNGFVFYKREWQH